MKTLWRRLASLTKREGLGGVIRRHATRHGWYPVNLDSQKTAKYWEKQPQYGSNWYSFPITSAYIIESVTGQSEKPITFWLIEKYLTDLPIKRLLVVCCGHGNKERGLAEVGLFEKCDAYDISEGAINSARELAVRAGVAHKIHYGFMDFNSPGLMENEYDLVLCNGALHHIKNVEACVRALERSLKVGGWLWASEFTGPSRYRYSVQEVAAINKGKELLFPELGGSRPFQPDQLKPKLDADPSEAIRSCEIEGVLRTYFADLEVKPYGGNILMRALDQEFFQKFDNTNDEHVRRVKAIIELEKELLRTGHRSHHAYFIARKTM